MISAVVVNWNGRDYLPDCVQAILDQDPPPDEVIVVDNHSDDGSRELVAARFPGVRVLDTGANLGPARARNQGVEAARHELCLLVDNDVVLRPGCLGALRAVLDRDPMAAAVQARSLCGDHEDVVHYDGADLCFLGTLVLHNWFVPLAQATRPSGPVGAVIALCLLARRAALAAVGGFDEELFILFEDNQLSWKLRMHGRSLYLAPDALCVHRAGTAGLSVRGPDAAYSARRVFLHCRNRWLVLLTCMRWRTLCLTLPAQLVYSLVYLGFAVSRGALWAGVRGHLAALRALPAALSRRRAVQCRRTVPDRELLLAAPMTANPGLADRGLGALLRRGLDRGFAGYWRLVRRFCG